MCRVLIIEDSPVNMLLEVTILSRSGHQTFQAATAVDGVQMARHVHPDVILMDVGLPTLDGYAATRILKGDPLTRDIPIIAVTGFAMKADKQRAFEAGCDAYLTKPIAPRALVAEVESIVSKHSSP
jgi:two-component system, cell cycle response regulator DivK